jgi:hypothetical protein
MVEFGGTVMKLDFPVSFGGVCGDNVKSLDGVPKQFGFWLAIAILCWVWRGKTFPITLRKLSFVAWVLLSVWIGGAMIANALLPWWAASRVYWVLFLLGFIHEQLVEMGKPNYDRTMPNAEATVGAMTVYHHNL